MSTTRRGLSLIEVAIVLTLISVMMVLSLPMLSSANARARSELCQQNLVEIGQTIAHYARDTNHLPTLYNIEPGEAGLSLPEFIRPRVQSSSVLFCPSDETKTSQVMGTSYRWGTAFNNQSPAGIHDLVGQRMLVDREAYHPTNEMAVNEVVISQNDDGYSLSLLGIDPQNKVKYSRPILYLTDKPSDKKKPHHLKTGERSH